MQTAFTPAEIDTLDNIFRTKRQILPQLNRLDDSKRLAGYAYLVGKLDSYVALSPNPLKSNIAVFYSNVINHLNEISEAIVIYNLKFLSIHMPAASVLVVIERCIDIDSTYIAYNLVDIKYILLNAKEIISSLPKFSVVLDDMSDIEVRYVFDNYFFDLEILFENFIHLGHKRLAALAAMCLNIKNKNILG